MLVMHAMNRMLPRKTNPVHISVPLAKMSPCVFESTILGLYFEDCPVPGQFIMAR